MAVDTDKIAVVTVHGTGDTAEGPDGDKWFQNGSEFAERLQGRLSEQGVEAEIIPHLWTGANSASAREKGSMALTKLVKRLAKSHDGVHVIGHSHGGNVANDAACMLGWSAKKKKKPKISSITTVGTPFFKTIVHRSEKVGAWAFLVMVVVSMIVLALSLLTLDGVNDEITNIELTLVEQELAEVLADSETSPELLADVQARHEEAVANAEAAAAADAEDTLIGFATIGVVSGAAVILILPLAFRGISRIRRAGRKPRADPRISTIWHPNDEAIAFLQRVEALPIEVFPKWSLLRGSRTGAILWGVRAAIWTPLIGILLLLGSLFGELEGGVWDHSIFSSMEDLGLIVFSVGLVGAPILFGMVYFAYRAVVALLLEFGLRGYLNGVVGNSLRGLALGRDGDNRIGEVAERSHYYGCDARVLDGEVAQRMLVASQDATRRLFDKYRSSLFSVGVSEDNAVAELAQDAMTWDSLIHTTYFDQPEVAVMIADKIAENVRGPGVAVAPEAQAAE